MGKHLLTVLVTAALVTGCSDAPAPSASTFGGFPTYLPKDTVDGGALHLRTDASAAHPVLAVEGDTVRVHLQRGSVDVTMVGPEVPNEGLASQAPTTPATWRLTLSRATAPVPVAVAGFNAIDEQGRVYRLRPAAGSAVPTVLRPGQQATLALTTTIVTGEGRLRWIPTGHLAPVEWSFTVETD